jgi:cysteine synthase
MMAHYTGTGPEIWRQTRGKVDGFVTSSGTAGTLAGVTKFLKEQKPDLQAWIVDPDEVTAMAKFINDGKSTSFEKEGFEVVPVRTGSTIAEGVGLPRVTPNFSQAVLDKGITGTNQEIVDMAYFLLRNDGIFVGPSAALNVVGAVKMARELGPGHTIVTILCDSGDRYRSKLYNPQWLKEEKLEPKSEGTFSLDFVGPLTAP